MSEAYTIREAALGDLERELELTRAALERIPEEHLSWKPHERSWTLGELGGHIANLLGWGMTMLARDGFDLASAEDEPEQDAPATLDEILRTWDENAEALRDALDGVEGEVLGETWTLSHGDQVVTALPRGLAFRMWGINHLVHHRAQLGVYFRLLDVPVPATYGPSADEEG